MDTDLARMCEFGRFRAPVKFLLEPLLKHRAIAPMPCKHGRTFEMARQGRRELFEEIGEDDPADDDNMQQPEGYCDCGPFNRGNELWEIGEMCVKRGLTQEQMSDIAAIVVVSTSSTFDYNHFHHAMMDWIFGEHKNFRKALKRQREKGVSFAEAMPGIIIRWQWRMMPNA